MPGGGINNEFGKYLEERGSDLMEVLCPKHLITLVTNITEGKSLFV
jgi:hypothetical protein